MKQQPVPLARFGAWLVTGERGISSNAIVRHLCQADGLRPVYGDHPYDPADFRRCETMLRQVDPIVRQRMYRMASRSEEWAALVEHWDELVAIAEGEGVFSPAPRGATAPLLYRRMKELLDQARQTRQEKRS